jgi:DNA-binding MarR family transcriptional regulator
MEDKDKALIEQTQSYIYSLIDQTIKIWVVDDELRKRMPAVLIEQYKCYKSSLFGIPVMLCYPKEVKTLTPAQIQRHMQIMSDKCGIISIIVIRDIPSYNIQRLIHQRVNFIIVGKQMFVPSLLMDLRKLPKTGKDIKEEIPALAQCLILHSISFGPLWMSVNEIMEAFDVSYSTANRAVRWLKSKELVLVSRGKEKKVQMMKSGRSLWESCIAYLSSPIEKVVYSDERPDGALLAGMDAVRHYTNSANTNEGTRYAISKSQLSEITVFDEKGNHPYSLEVWKYNPKSLSQSIVVDILSLYICQTSNSDEKLTNVLENFIDRYFRL